MKNLHALVIDNSRHIREFVIEYVLIPNRFEVSYAVDGQDGLHKALTLNPDLILLDYEMPRLSGLEVLQELRRRGNKTAVILMTSHGSEQVAVDFFRLGVQDYVRKPFTPDEMSQAIENALAVTFLQREKEALTRRLLDANKQLEQNVQELNTLYQVGKTITALMSPDKMLNRLVDSVLHVTKSELCELTVFDPESGKVSGKIKRRYQPKPKGLLSKPKPSAPEGTLQYNKVALMVGKKQVGLLEVSRHLHPQADQNHEAHLLQMLADYAAIAVYNMQLMYQLQKTKEREKQQIRGMFERYVAPTVVDQLLTRPDEVSLGGTRQMAAILFADVRGFSQFSTTVSPEKLVVLLNKYLEVAAKAVLAQEGTLDKFMGDAVMAFFNAPLTQPDYALRAIRAAWALCRSVEQLYPALPPEFRLSFGVGVGVGEVVVGNIGTPQMMNFTVMGDAVNKAKRLQENAKGGQILINQETYDLVAHDVKVNTVGQIQLKGQNHTEPVYEVLAVRPLVTQPA